MASATITTFEPILKRFYPQTDFLDVLYQTSPTLAILPKSENLVGYDFGISLRYAWGVGGSHTFSKAQATKGDGKYVRFVFQAVDDYALISISTKLMRAARNNAGALVEAVAPQMEGAKYEFARSVSSGIWGNGGGARGRIASGSGSSTLTLTDPADIVNFEVGMTVVSDDTDGTPAGAADDGEEFVISAVNESAGTISKASGNWNTSGNYATNDYLFRTGDLGLACRGIAGWIPVTAPTVGGGDSWGGIDRAANPTRLAGWRYTATAADGSIERALINAGAVHKRSRARVTHCAMNPIDFGYLVNELGSKVSYDRMVASAPSVKKYDDKGNAIAGAIERQKEMDERAAAVGFECLTLCLATGTVKVYPDSDCPRKYAYLLQRDTWHMRSMGEFPGWLQDDGKGIFLRESNADANEARLGAYYQLGCDAPGWNMVVDLTNVVPA